MSRLAPLLIAALLAPCAFALAQDASASPDQIRQNMRRLWRENVQCPPDAQSQALAAAMTQLAAINIRDAAAPSEQGVSPSSAPAEAPASQPSGITPEMIARLKALTPQDVQDPARIADRLFEAAQLEAAGVLYELALQKTPTPELKAWLLFQLANCKRTMDVQAAQTLYQQVATEHASSPWAQAATVNVRVLEWQRQSEPLKVIQQAQQIVQK